MQHRYLNSKLESITPEEFGQFVADIWEQHGFRTEVVDSSTRGVDIVARRKRPYPRTELVQARRYPPDDSIGSELVQQCAAQQQQKDADAAVIVTTNPFSDQARELATKLEVVLIDDSDLCELIHSGNLYSELQEYVHIIDSRHIGFDTEMIAERIVEETGIDASKVVNDSLVSYFNDEIPDARVSEQATLAAFSDNISDWKTHHSVSLNSIPEIDSADLSTYILANLRESDSEVVSHEVLSAAIELIFDQQIPTSLEQVQAEELADWFINDFDAELVPLVAKDSGLAVDVAESIIDTEDSVAVNKLRVAEGLNCRVDEWL